MKKDYRKLVAKGRVFLATTEKLKLERPWGFFIFLDTVLDKKLNLRIGELVSEGFRTMIFYPELFKIGYENYQIRHRVPRAAYYDKIHDMLYSLYMDIAKDLGLPKDFGVGLIRYNRIKKKVTKEDGSVSDILVFTCYSFPPDFFKEKGYNFLPYLLSMMEFIKLIESCNLESAKEITETKELDIKGWDYLDTYLSDVYDADNKDVPPCGLLDVKFGNDSTGEEIVPTDDYQKRINLFLLEYVMNLCEASKTSVDNITYTPKSYLVLYATKNNHTKIKLSPSQMAMYCYIQGFKSYGISKRRLIEDINSHRGRYRKLCMLFGATHTDYDMARLKVVVTQINSKIRTELAKANEGQESFDFTLWTDKLLIKSRNKQRYYIGVSERKFKPVIVDDNRRFVDSPDDFIDQL